VLVLLYIAVVLNSEQMLMLICFCYFAITLDIWLVTVRTKCHLGFVILLLQ